MGGWGKFLGDAVSEAAGKMFDGWGKLFEKDGSGFGLGRSGDALLEKSRAGRRMRPYLNEYEQEARKAMMANMKNPAKVNFSAPPDLLRKQILDASKDAWHTTRSAYFGKHNEAWIKMIMAARSERGPVYADTMADFASVYLHDQASYWRQHQLTFAPGLKVSLTDLGIRAKPKYVEPEEFEKMLKTNLSVMYTQGIAIPHLSQIGNALLREGVPAVSRALAQWTKAMVMTGHPDRAFADLIASGALTDEFMFQALSDAKTPGASFADKIMHAPGFGWTRRQFITLTGLAGKNVAETSAYELSQGKNIKVAEFKLRRVGIDPARLRQQGFKLTNEDIQRAMYNAVNSEMFLHSERYTPWKWEENWPMRFMFMYRRFHFRQGAFIGKTFYDAYKMGPAELAKTIAVFGTFFPVAGWFIHQLQRAILLQGPQNPLKSKEEFMKEYFEGLGFAGGFGMYYTLYREGMRNYLRGGLEGPLFSTVDDMRSGVGHIIQGFEDYGAGEDEKGDTQMRAGARLIISKFGIPGRAIAAHIKKAKEDQENQ